MPPALTYPGVYIEELTSAVRTIAGVSTSVTAFVGPAKRGPVNKAVHILSFSEYERRFGGLDSGSDMSYAVSQFFLNGGSDSWVVRLAGNPLAGKKTLTGDSNVDVIEIKALDDGFLGNDIEVRVDYPTTGNTSSTFNLTVNYAPKDSPADSISERFEGLSMNSKDSRYAESMVKSASRLVSLTRIKASTDAISGAHGSSTSGDLVDDQGNLIGLQDANHDQFRVSVDGGSPIKVQITPADLEGQTAAEKLGKLASAIQSKIGGNPQLVTVFAPENKRISITSATSGEFSTVRVLPGEINDISSRLKLGSLSGGTETDAVAGIRPKEIPDRGTLKSGVFANAGELDGLPSQAAGSLQISLDGSKASTINLGNVAIDNNLPLDQKLSHLAGIIQSRVRSSQPSTEAYNGFTCTVSGGNRLLLASGTRGTGSSVSVNPAPPVDIALRLHLLTGSESTPSKNAMLEGGSESSLSAENIYRTFVTDRADRKGLYALEEVDIFNILCLPGVTMSGILHDASGDDAISGILSVAAAYCKERRAFLIVDAPISTKPGDMAKIISGTSLPKTENGAVYYPWIRIADPLSGGKLRSVPPSGTIAGLYARTDSNRGVWKAPAGTEAILADVKEADYALTDIENGILNPRGVNCIRVFPVYGPVSWGARTLMGDNQMSSQWKYIPIRRLALFIEESLFRGTQWVVFEPNDEPLWAQIRLNIGAFMHNLFTQGAFQGGSPRDAYFVKCDKDTTTQNDIDLGIVNIIVGFAPLKPAEFVVIKIQQMAGQIQV